MMSWLPPQAVSLEKLSSPGWAPHSQPKEFQKVPPNTSKQRMSVLYIRSPWAGFWMAWRWTVLKRGSKRPLVVSFISNKELACGVLVLMPTDWLKAEEHKPKKTNRNRRRMVELYMLKGSGFLNLRGQFCPEIKIVAKPQRYFNGCWCLGGVEAKYPLVWMGSLLGLSFAYNFKYVRKQKTNNGFFLR